MKECLTLFLLLIMLIPFGVNAEKCDSSSIKLESISVNTTSGTAEEVTEANVSGKIINLDLMLYELGDAIEYNLKIKNTSSEDFYFDDRLLKSNTNYMKYEFIYDDNSNVVKAGKEKTIKLRVEYNNKVPKDKLINNSFTDTNKMTLSLFNKNLSKNPKTSNIFMFLLIVLLIITITSLIILRKKKYTKYIVLIITTLLIPFGVYALCKYDIEVEVKIAIINNKATNVIENLVDGADETSTELIEAQDVSDSCNNSLAYDGTSDNNLRYVGINPCNYVSFNNEIWRIIGVMNNVEDGNGNKEKRIKIVRSEPLSNYSWNQYLGPNDWGTTPMASQLNNEYLNNELNATAKSMIGNTVWYLGGHGRAQDSANQFYQSERGNAVWGTLDGQTCDDSACPRSTEWVGKIAFMYPSDYGFSTSDRSCLNLNVNNYAPYCKFSTWFKIGELFITPSNDYSNFIFAIENSGYGEGNVVYYYVYQSSRISPSLYLKANVKIDGGNGSLENPFTLSLE